MLSFTKMWRARPERDGMFISLGVSGAPWPMVALRRGRVGTLLITVSTLEEPINWAANSEANGAPSAFMAAIIAGLPIRFMTRVIL